MKHLTLIAAWAAFLPTALIAQPTITLADAPQDGQQYTFSYGQYFTIDQSGPSTTWDLGELEATGEGSQITFYDIDVVGYADQFPTAQVAMEEGPNLLFMRADPSGLYTVGQHLVTSGLQFNVQYQDEQLVIPYPLAYGDSFEDDWAYTYTVQGMDVSGSGHAAYTAEGFGTLVLPFGALENVLMLRGTLTNTESTTDILLVSEQNSVLFYKPGISFTVAQVQAVQHYQNGEPAGSGQATVFMSAAAFAGMEEQQGQQVGIQAWPNPASKTLQLAYGLGAESQVEINLYDPTGKVVRHLQQRTRTAGIHNATLDVSGLAAGIHLLVITDDKGQRGACKVLVE